MKLSKKAGIAGVAAVMCLGMAVPAFAADPPTKDVTGTYNGSGAAVLAISAQFGDMKFIYNAANGGTWNPNTHAYEGAASEAGWSMANATSGDVIVTNHSNVAINAKVKFTAAKEGIKFGTDNPTGVVIASAVGTQVDAAPTGTIKVGPTKDCGALAEGDKDVKLGTVTVEVTRA